MKPGRPILVFALLSATNVSMGGMYHAAGVQVEDNAVCLRESGVPVKTCSFAVASDWKIVNGDGKLDIAAGREFMGRKCLYLGGAAKKCDTWFSAISPKIPVEGGSEYIVTMNAYSDKPISSTTYSVKDDSECEWANAVVWYGSGGKRISSDGFPFYLPGGKLFEEIAVRIKAPADAVGMSIKLAFDRPNIGPGQVVAFCDLAMFRLEGCKRYVQKGSFVSEVARGGTLDWKADAPAGTSVRFQWRGAAMAKDVFSAAFRGPDGSAETFYDKPFFADAPFVQYRAVLTSSGSATPVLKSVCCGGRTDDVWDFFADIRPPRVRIAGESSTTDGKFLPSLSITDSSIVESESVGICIDGKDMTAMFKRDGDMWSMVAAPSAEWKAGLHEIVVSAADCRGNAVKARKAFFVGEPSCDSPKCELRKDGMALVDGKPFFPVGIYAVCKREFNGHDFDRAFGDIAAAGFNFAHAYGSAAKDPQFIAAAGKHGLKLWIASRFPDRWFMEKGRFEKPILAWYLGDDTCEHITPEQEHDYNDAVKAVDPGRLTCQADNLTPDSGISQYSPYVTATDVFMPEIYPVRGNAGDPSDRFCVAMTIRMMEQAKRDISRFGDGKPRAVWPILQWFKGWSFWHHFPTRDQLFATSFAAIVHGANGIVWYTYGGFFDKKRKKWNEGATSSPERWRDISELASLIRDISPVLLSEGGTRINAEIVSGAAADPFGGASVTALLKRHCGYSYLIAVNAAPEQVKARFRLQNAGEKAEVVNEHRTIPCKGEVLEDDFKPFGVRIYRFIQKERK